jgi:hypothetical protein
VGRRLASNWVYGGFLAGILLLILAPLIVKGWPRAVTAVFLLLPAYMVHQYEEHDDDRFRRFVNQKMGDGRVGLSPMAVFVINVPVVWGVIALALYLAAAINAGLGLIAAYLVLVNGVVHAAPALVTRSYNPGLVTAVVIFLPLGIYSLLEIQAAGGGTAMNQAIGLAAAVGIHAAIVAYATRRRAGGAVV